MEEQTWLVVLTEVRTKNTASWDIASCSLVNRYHECRLQFRSGVSADSSEPSNSFSKTEVDPLNIMENEALTSFRLGQKQN
jgi:hypothetical protein